LKAYAYDVNGIGGMSRLGGAAASVAVPMSGEGQAASLATLRRSVLPSASGNLYSGAGSAVERSHLPTGLAPKSLPPDPSKGDGSGEGSSGDKSADDGK
jgi:hypothetical protein